MSNEQVAPETKGVTVKVLERTRYSAGALSSDHRAVVVDFARRWPRSKQRAEAEAALPWAQKLAELAWTPKSRSIYGARASARGSGRSPTWDA